MVWNVWIALGVGLLVAGILLLLAAGARESERFSRERRLRCPFSGRDVFCTIVQDTRTGMWVEVRSCSAFSDPRQVLCGAPCLRILNRGFTTADKS